MSKDKLIKRLSWYYPAEKFNAFLFLGIQVAVILWYGFFNTIFLTYGLFLMVVILFQGQHYWKLKLYRLINKDFNQQKNIAFFKKMKRLNVALIALIPIVLLLQLFLSNWTIKPDNLIGWAIAANIFGMLEHINYYHKQLTYDNSNDLSYLSRYKKLKIASLKKDLDENRF